jgi:hypothetical protein
MLVSTDGSTPFEKITAEAPRTMIDLAMLPDTSDIKALSKTDANFISKMSIYMKETFAWCQAKAAERVSHHMASLYASNDRRRQTRFQFVVGQRVSYKGEPVVITELIHKNPDGYISAKVRRVTHDAVEVTKVAYDALKPLGDPRPELLINKGADLRVGDFVFHGIEIVKAGVVSSPGSKSGSVTIIAHEQSRKQPRRFSPVIKKNGTKSKAAQTVKTQIQTSDVQAVTQISDSGYIPKAMALSLSARGLMTFGEEDELMPELTYPTEVVKAYPVQLTPQGRELNNRLVTLRAILDLLKISPFWSERDMMDQVRRSIYPAWVGGWSCSTDQLNTIYHALQQSNGEVTIDVRYHFMVTLPAHYDGRLPYPHQRLVDEYEHRRAYRSGRVLTWGSQSSDPAIAKWQRFSAVEQKQGAQACGSDTSALHQRPIVRQQVQSTQKHVDSPAGAKQDAADDGEASSTTSSGSSTCKEQSNVSLQINCNIRQMFGFSCMLCIVLSILKTLIDYVVRTILQ